VTKCPPSQQLVHIAQRLKGPKQKAGLAEDLDAFRSEVRILHESFQEIETSTEEARLQSIGNAVKAAFRLTGNGVSLQGRLRKLGCDPSIVNSRVIHEINKLSNYWRISCTLAQFSRCREYRTLFEEPKLETLEPYEPSERGSSSRHVHAEIQLVVHYEMWPKECLPRVIGASKQACYLCYAFVKAHKQFCLLRSHGQIYNKWTVPDRSEYTLETLERIQRALGAVNQEVLDEIKRTRRSLKTSRNFPLQSSINLQIPEFPEGSDTTVKSSKSSRMSLAARQLRRVDPKPRRPETPSPASLVDARNGEHDTDVGGTHWASETSVSKCEHRGLVSCQVQTPSQDPIIDVGANTTEQISITTDLSSEPKGLILDWLDLHFDPSQAAGGWRTQIELRRCESTRKMEEEGEKTIDTDHWLPGQEITVPINKLGPELEIVFARNYWGRIRMRVTSQGDQC